MNAKKVKQLKGMAALFYQMQPKTGIIKTVDQIYNELKTVHKNKKK